MKHIDLEPIGRRIDIDHDADLLEITQDAGIEMAAVCGGEGWCGKCRVQLIAGELSPPTADELDQLTDAERAAGFRLACQAVPLGDVKIDIPPESLSTAQRLQLEGEEIQIEPDPVVIPVDLELDPPQLHDLRADTTRLHDALTAQGHPAPRFGLDVLRSLPDALRQHDWRVRVALRGDEVVAVLPQGAPLLGLAVDLGTTKIAAYLVDLHSGEAIAKAGAPNPQVAYGEDVVSRIAYANNHPGGLETLQSRVADRLNELLAELCLHAAAHLNQVVEAVIVGNTAMHHLFLGLPTRQLGEAPYVAAINDAAEVPAAQLGLALAPGTYVYLPPNIAGYVGGDHVAMLLATRDRFDGVTIALDIGTNTEISLIDGERMLSCSCASGPAFEGAHIQDGMRALPGAIERVLIHEGEVRTQTIDGAYPIGICGSGILDAVAEMYGAGIVNQNGRLLNGSGYTLVPAGRTGHGRDIHITRRDVHEIQLAKGAIKAGVDVLLAEAGKNAGQIDRFIVAGAFGTYLDLSNAIRINMFPELPLDRFQQVGNAAGIGARQMLISRQHRAIAADLLRRVEYIELTVHPGFTDIYVDALLFGE